MRLLIGRECSLRKIEAFTTEFLRRVQQPRKCPVATFRIGAPRAREKHAIRWVFWEYPSRREERMQQWAQLFRVLELMHTALSSNTHMTKRDIFYRDVGLFLTQRIVDSMVYRIELTLGLPRSALGVSATPKGMVTGPVCFRMAPGGNTGRGSRASQAPLVGATTEQVIPDLSAYTCATTSAAWMLIVEKDAVYETLRACDFLSHGRQFGVRSPGVLLTGKGYPDVSTRWLVRELALQPVRLFFLMDAGTCGYMRIALTSDPHGIDILRTYTEALISRYFASLKPQRAGPQRGSTHWIGLRTDEWLRRGSALPVVPLSAVDRKKGLQLLLHRPALPVEWRHELARQLHTGYKGEIELLCSPQWRCDMPASAAGDLVRYLYQAIGAALGSRARYSTERRK